ncbi:MAG TPA: hypothetical protein VGJ14_00810 [Sporichthyaceae bacterium]
MRSTATRCLIVTTLGLGASVPTVAAAADRDDKIAPQISAVTLNPNDVLLPASRSAHKTTAFTISMRVSDPSGVDTVVAGLYGPKGGSGRAYRLARTSGTAANGMWKVVVRLANPQSTGQWQLQAFAVDNKQNSTDPGRVYGDYLVREATHFAHFDATEPTPVGQDVKFSGFLQRFDHKTGWTGYPGREVAIEFRPAGGKAFRPVQTVRTGADGSVSGAAVVAKSPGTWRMSFAGNPERAPSVSRADDVGLPAVATPPRPAVPPGVRCQGTCPTATPTPRAERTADPTPTPTPAAKRTADPTPTPTATYRRSVPR